MTGVVRNASHIARWGGLQRRLRDLFFVFDIPGLSFVVEIQPLHLFEIEWPRTAAAEHGDLLAGLVDAAIAIEAFRERQGRARGLVSGNQFGNGFGAEAVKIRL